MFDFFFPPQEIIESISGSLGIRDLKMLQASLAQPFMTFDGKDLYKTIIEQEKIILQVALGNMNRKDFTYWLKKAVKKLNKT